ncbi:MAG: hypothetical protein KME07_16640 [Pegethrix bostrychoides GSE-TBD4-15B]|jgi:hypothetical protein|uniref:Uncharacterized protein n=1 Tax=Pegethrix bostrychoides GSE-TBD4-15B TaxID=2839662 RepID=A0A951U5N4_9CYAN|nr:hypothetical protein [Pegethrix bostrychoides GSE-TBD4-15B]
MQYLLIDTHQRPLGTMSSDRSFAVGDTLQNHNAEVFTVVGLNWFKQRTHANSLTIIPGQVQLKAKTV